MKGRSKQRERRWLKLTIVLVVAVFVGLSMSAVATNDANGDGRLSDEMVARYVHTGNYNRDLVKQLMAARHYLDFRIELNRHQPVPKKLAVVLAVDNTALADEPRLRRLFIHPPASKPVHRPADEPVIWAVRAFYEYVRARGVSVFFVTARDESRRQQTRRNLEREGYISWEALLMRPVDSNESVVAYKQRSRYKITKMGYEIVLNIGSKLTDLRGLYQDRVVLLPLPDTHQHRSLRGMNTLS